MACLCAIVRSFPNVFLCAMPAYQYQVNFLHESFTRDGLDLCEFEACHFVQCNFEQCHFKGVAFINCVFDTCTFDGAAINHVALRKVHFRNCTVRDVNFAMCDKLLFEIRFTDCVLDFSKFYGLRLRDRTFERCSMVAADFMSADLSRANFNHCDLHRAEFERADLSNSDLATSRNYTIDPSKTKVKNARVSRGGLAGLLTKHEISVV